MALRPSVRPSFRWTGRLWPLGHSLLLGPCANHLGTPLFALMRTHRAQRSQHVSMMISSRLSTGSRKHRRLLRIKLILRQHSGVEQFLEFFELCHCALLLRLRLHSRLRRHGPPLHHGGLLDGLHGDAHLRRRRYTCRPVETAAAVCEGRGNLCQHEWRWESCLGSKAAARTSAAKTNSTDDGTGNEGGNDADDDDAYHSSLILAAAVSLAGRDAPDDPGAIATDTFGIVPVVAIVPVATPTLIGATPISTLVLAARSGVRIACECRPEEERAAEHADWFHPPCVTPWRLGEGMGVWSLLQHGTRGG